MIEKTLDLIIQLLNVCFALLGETIDLAITGIGKRKHAHTAQFASERTLLSRYNTGFNLTGRRSLSNKNSYINVLACGGTGTGKSSVILIPSLYTMSGSFVIHDPSGELHSGCAAYLVSRGYIVKVLYFSHPRTSAQYNPLHRAHTSSEIQKVATLLVQNTLEQGKSDPFWNNSAIGLLCMLISLLKQNATPQYQNLYNVRYLITQMGSNPKQVDALFEHCGDPILRSEYAAFIASDDKVISGVLATCRAALTLFSDTAIAQVTAGDTLDMDDFRKKPTALFIMNGTADAKYFAPLTSLLFEQFFASILNRLPEKDDLDAYMLIDEAATLTLPTLPQFVANARKYRAGSLLLVQDYKQLVHNYGAHNADAIRTNCHTKIFFPGQPHDACKELSDSLGKFEFKNEQGNTVLRSLMTADEIRTMPSTRALLIAGNKPPILARLRPYYKQRRFRAYSKLPPASFADNACTQLLTIPLPHVEEKK